MNVHLRRLLIAIAAWPLGIVAALVLLFIPLPWDTPCPPNQPCELREAPLWRTVAWLCIAFGPGVLATRAWWQGRSDASEPDDS